MLEGVRVLELSQPQTMLAGQMLADLGADVIAVEPPGGAPGRRLGPFLGDRVGLDRSLSWHALNRNKRAITLDVDSTDGRAVFLSLASRADIVIETAPARFAGLRDAGLVHGCVRAFSLDGPKSGYAFTDRTVIAASGSPSYTGDGDRAPLFFPVPQAMMEAGAETAIGVLAALSARDRDGTGQRVDVSMRAAAMMSAFGLPYHAAANEPPALRGPSRRRAAGIDVPQIFACRDGCVLASITFGAFGEMTQRMTRWLIAEHGLDAALAEVDWSHFPESAGDRAAQVLGQLIAGLGSALAGLGKSDIGQAARTHRFFAAPLMDMSDVARFGQYAERGLWVRQPVGDGVTVDAPARVAQFSNYAIELHRPAPALSQHTQEVLMEAGHTAADVQALFCHGIV